jgi:hypothetical protein
MIATCKHIVEWMIKRYSFSVSVQGSKMTPARDVQRYTIALYKH